MADSPVEKALLGQVLSHSAKHFRRVDAYLTDLRNFLSSTPDWQSQHDKIFNEMLRSVRVSRMQGIASTLIALLLIITLAVYAWHIVPRQQQELADRLVKANLAIDFKEIGSDLSIKYITEPPDTIRDKLLNDANLYGTAIGRYSGGLGSKAVLGFKRDEAEDHLTTWRWNVTPQSQESTIGTLTVGNTGGTVDRSEVFFGDNVQYLDLPELYLRIDDVIPKPWVDMDSERNCQYKVKFGVKSEEKSDPVWSPHVYVRYSPNGSNEDGPFLVSAPGWSSVYVANVAIGYWGEDAKRVAYHVKSDAYRISFN